MKAIKEYIESKVSVGSIILNAIVLIFIAGGFYAITPAAIEKNTESIHHHIDEQFKPLRDEVRQNREAINRISTEMIPREEAVDQSDLGNLRDLMREIQSSQDQQMKQLNNRLDYIIKRLDK